MKSKKTEIARWGLEDALECWGTRNWGSGMFGINPRGHLSACLDDRSLDLKLLVDEVRQRGIELPLLIRLLDILDARVRHLHDCFGRAMREFDYSGGYRAVYPIKVNQQRHVIEKLQEAGRPYHLGLEVGSKPELLAAVAQSDDPEALIICNGFKDLEYIESALLARRLQEDVIIVLDRPDELGLVLEASRRLKIEIRLGMRAKLTSAGAGRWRDSTGHRAKFGLTVPEIVDAVDRLKAHGMLDALVLMHFHVGSQIADISALKRALREAARLYIALHQRGAQLRYLDVGGGLGVDYAGTRSVASPSSTNYTSQEYANDVVFWVKEACDQAGIPTPTLITESGRALVAHHSVLVFNALGVNSAGKPDLPIVPEDTPRVIKQLLAVYEGVSRDNVREYYHDLLHLRNDYRSLFNHGLLDLEARALAERIFWACSWRIRDRMKDLESAADELAQLDAELADTYYCNFSLFQSLPDAWAVEQLFPIAPIHRLLERPTRRAVLVDLTCDSDGRIKQYTCDGEHRQTLDLHEPVEGDDYLLGVFLVGAYQESLGDLHNLFGDINAVHVSITGNDAYRIDQVVEGDTVADVLRTMRFSPEELVARLRRKVDDAVHDGRLGLEQSRGFLNSHIEALRGYTYLE